MAKEVQVNKLNEEIQKITQVYAEERGDVQFLQAKLLEATIDMNVLKQSLSEAKLENAKKKATVADLYNGLTKLKGMQ